MNIKKMNSSRAMPSPCSSSKAWAACQSLFFFPLREEWGSGGRGNFLSGQWLRLLLPTQTMQVQSVVRELRSHIAQAKKPKT